MINTNKVNTTFSDKDLNKLTKEERKAFKDAIASIQFVRNLISPDRKYCKDLKRYKNPNTDETLTPLIEDPEGKIKVDLASPHILEDVDYFRQPAIYFKEHGVFTHIMPSGNPYSDYIQFWNNEIKKCWHGMIRPSDGEWITGYHYFYLNYVMIERNILVKGSKKAKRTYDHPDMYDGDYLFFHYLERAREHGKHTCTLKKRGAGYSYKGAAKLARNFILGEDEDTDREVSSFAIANEKEYLTKDGVLNKFISVVDFCGSHTPWPRRKELKDSWNLMHWIMGYKDAKSGLEKGTKNQVMGVTLKNDAERARGKRGVLIEWEEFGKFTDSLKAWNIGRPSVEADGFAFGLMNAYGTGGTKGVAFEGLRSLFYNPNGYNVMPLANVYDNNARPGTECAFFHATYLNAEGIMDENGNSDVTTTLLQIIKDRIKIKYGSRDTSTLIQMVAEKPITPQEAIMRVGGSIFPITDIRDYLEEARVNEVRFTSDILVGELILISEDEVRFEPNPNLTPIRTYKPGVSDLHGAVEIFKTPETDRNNKVQGYRYIGGIDPVDNDYVLSGSLASCFIFDTITEQIVAEFTGRPQLAEDFYEIVRRLLIYYNAQGNYENNIKGLFGYFNNKNCLYLLCDTPQYLRDIEEVKGILQGNRAKGTRTTQGVSAQGKRLQKSWMLSPYEYIDGEGNEKKSIYLRTIKSLGYLEELEKWNEDGNFDRVSAMDMVMILREDRLKITKSLQNTEPREETDPFISKNLKQWTTMANKTHPKGLPLSKIFK